MCGLVNAATQQKDIFAIRLLGFIAIFLHLCHLHKSVYPFHFYTGQINSLSE